MILTINEWISRGFPLQKFTHEGYELGAPIALLKASHEHIIEVYVKRCENYPASMRPTSINQFVTEILQWHAKSVKNDESRKLSKQDRIRKQNESKMELQLQRAFKI